MMRDLIKGLRGELLDCKCYAHGLCECTCDTVWPESLCATAADEIERLNVNLNKLRNGIKPVVVWLENGCDPLEASKELFLLLEASK